LDFCWEIEGFFHQAKDETGSFSLIKIVIEILVRQILDIVVLRKGEVE